MDKFETYGMKEAVEILGCSDYTLRKLAKQNEIPYFKVGNRYRFTAEGLERWVRDQEVKHYRV